MTYETRMYFNLATPCLLSAGLSCLAIWVATTVAGPLPPLADAPLVIAGLGTLITTGVVAWQAVRVSRWQAGKAPRCLACGCLLGEPRQRRWSICRPCLGCGKFASTE